jgi:hypothetical protein
MARDLGALIQPLVIAEEPGLDSLDPRFNAITTLASHGQYGPAADQVEELHAAGIYDVRLIVTYLFQAFREDGIARLGEVLDVVTSMLGDNFEAVGPLKRREDNFERRLSWLFTEIADTLQFHITGQTETWTTLRAGVTAESLEAITAKLTTVIEQIKSRNLVRAARSAGRLDGWLAGQSGAITGAEVAPPAGADGSTQSSGYAGTVKVHDFTTLGEETPSEETSSEETPSEETSSEETPSEETPAEETPSEETPAEETPSEETPAEETHAEETPAEETHAEETPAEETHAEEAPAPEPTPVELPHMDAVALGGDTLQLPISYPFVELVRKLQAFELLVQGNQFRKAALVADDIHQILTAFDPRNYFPSVFSGFSASFSENFDALEKHAEERGTPRWQALGQFYKTDLERFVKS